MLNEGEQGRNLRILQDDPVKGPVIGGLTEEDVPDEGAVLQVIQVRCVHERVHVHVRVQVCEGASVGARA